MKLLHRPPLFAALLVSLLSASAAPLVTPYARQDRLEIRALSLSATNVERYSRIAVQLDLSATFDNPFDPDDIAVEARVRSPSRSVVVPGFFTAPYRRELHGGREKLTRSGPPHWEVRFTPTEVGQHTLVIKVRDRSGQVESKQAHFLARASGAPGFVRVSPRDRRYFEFDNGRSYFPIGANVCWAYGRGTFDYDDWFAGYATNGGNYARLWLSPHWSTFALERPGKREDGLGLGQFDLGNAWRIDYVLDLAAARGLRLMLCIDSYNILRQKDGYPQWDSTPHNAAHGGPLAHPTEFWTSGTMDTLYRHKLRYLVARYAADTAVLSWEFWNEVDIITGYRTGPVKDWHARMAAALRALDPYAHLITTSFAGTPGDKAIDTLPGLDYVQTHHYNSPDLAITVARAQAQKSAYGKPHLVGEIGADSGGPRTKDDPLGLQVHDPQWVSIVTGAAGSAQPWWWDNLIHPRRLYPLFGAVARFTSDIDWPAEQFRGVAPRLEWQTKPNPLPRADHVFSGGPMTWSASEFNQPRRVQLTRDGAKGQLPLAALQHGVSNHPREHNPVTFDVDLPWPTRFEVVVGDVSGHGGAGLKITLDGDPVVMKTFEDPDGNKSGTTLKQYAGSYGVDVPAGKHTVVVENTGADWFMADYRFRNAVEQVSPPLVAWASVGAKTAVAWVRLEGRTWERVCARKETMSPCPPSVLVLPGVGAADWEVELWDTWNGRVIGSQQIRASDDGQMRVPLPVIETDVALKLRKR